MFVIGFMKTQKPQSYSHMDWTAKGVCYSQGTENMEISFTRSNFTSVIRIIKFVSILTFQQHCKTITHVNCFKSQILENVGHVSKPCFSQIPSKYTIKFLKSESFVATELKLGNSRRLLLRIEKATVQKHYPLFQKKLLSR